MSNITRVIKYESKNKQYPSYTRAFYESGREYLFYLNNTPETCNKFCLKCAPFIMSESSNYMILDFVPTK